MSHDNSDIPPELQSLLERERAEDGSASDLEEIWARLDRAALPESALPDAEDTWAGVRRHIDSEETSEAPQRRDRRARPPTTSLSTQQRRWRWVGAATAVLALLLVGWWWTQPVEMTAPPGPPVTRTLPDGSTVELHGDSRLTYPRTLSSISVLEAERRVVHLRGEAYFEVDAGERPFIVQTPSVWVEVVGTAFSVRSRRGNSKEALVALEEGRLHVTNRAGTTSKMTLHPGEAALWDPNNALRRVSDTSLARVTAWRRGGFAATDRSLSGLARALERRFGHSIRLASSISPDARSAPLTVYYSSDADLETILHDVCMARGLSYRTTANGYVLLPADESEAPPQP